jgi:hypothetical protein
MDGGNEDETDVDDEDEKEEEMEDEDEEEDEDEDDGKEPQSIGGGEIANPSADDVDTMVDDQPIVLPEHVQEMHVHTTWEQPPLAAPWLHTQEPHPRP